MMVVAFSCLPPTEAVECEMLDVVLDGVHK